MYRTCPSGACQALLLRPDGKTFDLASERPDIAQALQSSDWKSSTLSFDAKWVGVSAGAAYTVYSLADQDLSYELPAGSPGSTWLPIDWNLSSGSLALAQEIDGHFSAMAIVDTTSFGDKGVNVYRLAEDPGLVPVGNGGDSIQMVQPRDEAQPPRVTELSIKNLQIDSTDWEPGQIETYGDPVQLAQCMNADETLLGPNGVPSPYQPPPVDTDGPEANGILVYRNTDGNLTPSAIIQESCQSSDTGRYELPSTTSGASWSMPMPVTTTESLVAETTSSGQRRLDLIGIDTPLSLVSALPSDARVLAPGMASLQ
jgi:hypothetical protein